MRQQVSRFPCTFLTKPLCSAFLPTTTYFCNVGCTAAGEQLHVASVWHYALSEGKAHGSEATFDEFEDNSFHMNAPAPTGPLLRNKFAVLTSTVVETQRSEDGTVKLLVRLAMCFLK